MRRIRTLMGAVAVGTLLFVAGCTDAPTAPAGPSVEPSYGLLDSDPLLLGDEQVTVLERSVTLAEDEVVTKTIGPPGGLIHLPEAGLTVWFPTDALSEPTEITVTAPAGDLVGYHFEPHGLEFVHDVTVAQDMTVTDLTNAGDLSAVYFEGELEPTVTALETLPLWLLRSLGVFNIEHFSGYVIATN